jgi:hypothetical protein
MMSVLEKVYLLDKLDKGIKIFAVGWHYAIYKLITHFITRNEDKIRESIKVSAALSVTASCVSHHDPFLEKTEQDLWVWLEG